MLSYESHKDFILITTKAKDLRSVVVLLDDGHYFTLSDWHTNHDNAMVVFNGAHYTRKRVVTQNDTEAFHANVGEDYEKLEPTESWEIHESFLGTT